MSDHTITIRLKVPPRTLGQTAKTFAFIFGFIGIGVAVHSPAMQWMGFLVSAFGVVSIVIMATKKTVGLSIADARKRLDEIEKDMTL